MASTVTCEDLKALIGHHIKSSSVSTYNTSLKTLKSNGFDDMVYVYSNLLNVAEVLKSKGVSKQQSKTIFKHLKTIFNRAIVVSAEASSKFTNVQTELITGYSKMIVSPTYNTVADSDASSEATDMDPSEFITADIVVKEAQITPQNVCDNVRKLKTNMNQLVQSLNTLQEHSQSDNQVINNRLDALEKQPIAPLQPFMEQLQAFQNTIIQQVNTMQNQIEVLENMMEIVAIENHSKDLMSYTLKQLFKKKQL